MFDLNDWEASRIQSSLAGCKHLMSPKQSIKSFHIWNYLNLNKIFHIFIELFSPTLLYFLFTILPFILVDLKYVFSLLYFSCSYMLMFSWYYILLFFFIFLKFSFMCYFLTIEILIISLVNVAIFFQSSSFIFHIFLPFYFTTHANLFFLINSIYHNTWK